jgi:hypothetical protein
MIKNCVTINSNNTSKNQAIIRCLRILKILIEKSEVNGTARVKSHTGLIKQKVIRLNIIDDTSSKFHEFQIKVYGNTTIWELKEILSKKINVYVDFLRFMYQRQEISSCDHGKTLIDLKV